MIEIIKNVPKINKQREPFNLYQLQIDGLKSGWHIFPKMSDTLTLTIKKKKEKNRSVLEAKHSLKLASNISLC